MDWYLKFILLCAAFLIVYGLVRAAAGKRGSWSEAAPAALPAVAALPAGGEAESSGERRARAFLERYFPGRAFIRARPDFLENAVTGANLELDCYNDELKLAVEYNGRQHYEFVPYFHSNKEAFQNQRYRDELKKIYCRDHGIQLISIPYTEKNIEHYLARKLEEILGQNK